MSIIAPTGSPGQAPGHSAAKKCRNLWFGLPAPFGHFIQFTLRLLRANSLPIQPTVRGYGHSGLQRQRHGQYEHTPGERAVHAVRAGFLTSDGTNIDGYCK